jgi:tRNA(Ile)-lysidine synthase
MVAAECAALGHPHATLRWRWDGQGNLQDAARRARLALIDRWRRGIEHVLMGHTQDDVAETFLMRLARGRGSRGCRRWPSGAT